MAFIDSGAGGTINKVTAGGTEQVKLCFQGVT